MPEYKEVGEVTDTRIGNEPAENSLGSQEHVDAALQKANDGTSNTSNTPEPTLLAGKFKTRDDLVKGLTNAVNSEKINDAFLAEVYKTVEKQLGKPASAKSDPVPSASGKTSSEPSQDAAQQTQEKSTDEPKPDADKGAGEVNFDELGVEFGSTGKLSDQSYAKLEVAGFDRGTVDTYLAGIKANAQKLYDRVGGFDKYKSMIEWSVQNLPAAEQEAFDKAIGSANEAERLLAVDGAWKRFSDANGNPPAKRVSPTGGEILYTASGFRSTHEYIQALKDPRYGKDPAYEREIMARLKVSKGI